MTTRLPSTYRRNLPPWAPDPIQRFVPFDELRRQQNYPVPRRQRLNKTEPLIDPFK